MSLCALLCLLPVCLGHASEHADAPASLAEEDAGLHVAVVPASTVETMRGYFRTLGISSMDAFVSLRKVSDGTLGQELAKGTNHAEQAAAASKDIDKIWRRVSKQSHPDKMFGNDQTARDLRTIVDDPSASESARADAEDKIAAMQRTHDETQKMVNGARESLQAMLSSDELAQYNFVRTFQQVLGIRTAEEKRALARQRAKQLLRTASGKQRKGPTEQEARQTQAQQMYAANVQWMQWQQQMYAANLQWQQQMRRANGGAGVGRTGHSGYHNYEKYSFKPN